MPDLDEVGEYLEASLAELLKAAKARTGETAPKRPPSASNGAAKKRAAAKKRPPAKKS